LFMPQIKGWGEGDPWGKGFSVSEAKRSAFREKKSTNEKRTRPHEPSRGAKMGGRNGGEERRKTPLTWRARSQEREQSAGRKRGSALSGAKNPLPA